MMRPSVGSRHAASGVPEIVRALPRLHRAGQLQGWWVAARRRRVPPQLVLMSILRVSGRARTWIVIAAGAAAVTELVDED